MQPRERAITALTLGQADVVPHFELEMQLTSEYFGKSFTPIEAWAAEPENAGRFHRENAELYVEIAERFDHCACFYHHIHRGCFSDDSRPNFNDYVEGLRVLREADGGKRLLLGPWRFDIGHP